MDPVVIALLKLGCEKPTHSYLGDGVYSGLDSSGQVWLVTERYGVVHEIAINDSTYSALKRYAARIVGYDA